MHYAQVNSTRTSNCFSHQRGPGGYLLRRGGFRGKFHRALMAATTNDTKSPPLHPSVRRRVGTVVEAAFLLSTFAAIWGSVGSVLIAAIFR
jgi:hypothetical protein